MEKKINELAIECFKLNKEVQEKLEQLKDLKNSIKKKMIENNIKKINEKEFSVSHIIWKKKFTNSLKKEYENLGAEKINKHIADGLVDVSYKLNTEAYQRVVNQGQKIDIDDFVNKRSSSDYIVFRNK